MSKRISKTRLSAVAFMLCAGGWHITLAQQPTPAGDPESMRSYPNDATPYLRGVLPEDFTPGGKPAIPPGRLIAPKKMPEVPAKKPEKGSETQSGGNVSLSGADILSGAGLPDAAILIVDTVVSNTNVNLTNTETANDGETSIAINPLNPNEIVISAFSGGWGGGVNNAIIYHSLDGGLTWSQQGMPPPVGIPVTGPNDWTFDYGRNNQLSSTVLNNSDVISVTTTNPANIPSWLWNNIGVPLVTEITNINTASSIGISDQPWLLVNPDPATPIQDNVYVAYDDFSGAPDMQVAVSLGQNPPDFTRDVRVGLSTGGVNPGLRMAKDPRTGFVYALWQQCVGNCGGTPKTIDFYLNRSVDGGNTWILNGSVNGIIVATGDSVQPQPKFGTVNALLGGINHAAVDPNTGTLYYVYGDRDNSSGVQRLAVRRVTSNGDLLNTVSVSAPDWVSPDLNDAALPASAVVDDGTLGINYYTHDGFSSDGFPIFTNWLALSDDQGTIFTQHRLLTSLSPAIDSGAPRQRVLGDYMQMKTIGNCFYGAFTGNGAPFGRPISNHDPIFFKTCLGPQVQVNQSLTVPEACVGSVNTATLDICNAGLETLVLSAVNSDNPLFSVTPKTGGFPVNISPDACFPFEVNFSPVIIGDAGDKTAVLTLVSNDPMFPETNVSVSSTGELPQMTATLQSDGVFGDVTVGTSKLLNLEVLNQSNVCDLSVNNLARTVGDADFTFAGLANSLTFPVILQPGSNVDLPLEFTPSNFGPKAATFSLTTNDPDDSPTLFNVNGNSPSPEITVSGDLGFGQVCATEISERTVQICNVGVLNTLQVDASLVGAGCGDFEIVGNPFPADVSHDFCIDLTVKYTPTGVGDHNACDLQITSNDPDEGVIDIALSGSTPAPDIDVAMNQTFPATVVQSIGACDSKRAFPVQNNGSCPLTITDITITDNTAEYSLEALPSFPIILSSGELAGDGDLRVVFAPEALAYQSTGEISVTYETDPITGDTAIESRQLCGEAVNTGARVLVTHDGIPLNNVKKVHLQRVNANRNDKPNGKVDSLDNARNVGLTTVAASSSCPEINFHTEYGAYGNPVQLLPGSYLVTVQAVINGKPTSKTASFDVSTCDFNPSVVVNF
ncbi:MAG: choice-of-anchor D domain-containing protein [Methyloprofundus sp.]|nr:choice-of-anchor D domain-containing protein [Methyloprofundus sp.]